MSKDNKTMSFTVNDDIVAGVERVQSELGSVWVETLGAPMSRSEAIRWLVQSGLRSFESAVEAQDDRADIAFVSKGKQRKRQRTITLDARVDAALPALQKKLEENLYPYAGNVDLQALHGPVRYNASTTAQMALVAFMREMGIDPWQDDPKERYTGGGPAAGEETKDSAETE